VDLAWYYFPLVFITPLVLGVALLGCAGIATATDRLAYAGWAYIAGMLGTAAVLFPWLCLGLPPNPWLLHLVLLGVAACCFLLSRRQRPQEHHDASTPWRNTGRVERVFFIGVLALVLVVSGQRVMVGNLLPIADADEAMIWSAKAKLIFSSGGFGQHLGESAPGLEHGAAFPDAFAPAIDKALQDPTFAQNRTFQDAPRTGPDHHLDYPVLNPLLQVWVFAHAGGPLEWQNRLPIQGFGIALLLVLAAGLRQVLRPALVACCLLIFTAIDETLTQMRTCYADVMVAVGLAIACDAWLRSQRDRQGPWWWLVLLGLSVAAWSKNEGMMYLCVALVAGMLACSQRLPGPASHNPFGGRAGVLLVPFLFVGATLSINFAFGFTNDLIESDATGMSVFERLLHSGDRVVAIAGFTFDHLLISRDRCFVFLVFLVMLISCPLLAVKGPLRAPGIFLILAIVMVFLVYMATPAKIHWHLFTSLPRVMWQLTPCMLLWMAYLLRELTSSTVSTASLETQAA